MSDFYDPLVTQTTAITFRRLDALQDAVAVYGRAADGAPVMLLVAQDGTIQTRRLNRTTDEVVLIGTDAQSVARPVLTDSLGRLAFRPLSALPPTDFDGLRVYAVGPADAQTQIKADSDGTLHVNDATARTTLSSVLSAIQATQPRSITNLPADYPDALAESRLLSILDQLDVKSSAIRDGIAGIAPLTKTLYALDQDVTAALAATQPRQITNFPSDYPDALTASRLLLILGQLDRTLGEVFDVRSAGDAVTAAANNAGLTVTLDLGVTGRPHVQRFVSVGGSATVTTQVSWDGATWRTLETQSFALANTDLSTLPVIGYRYVRVTSATTGVALAFELSGAR